MPAQAVVAAAALATSNPPSSNTTVDPPTPEPTPPLVSKAPAIPQFASLQKQFSAAVNALAGAVSLLGVRSTSTTPDVQSQLDALQHQISQTNQINNLSNVTITSPTFSGVTTSNIPEGGNLYYTDARVEAVLAASTTIGTTFGANTWTALNLFSGGASTTNFSNFGTAYFGGSATSSFNSTGILSLVSNGLTVGTNQLVVSGGDVGIGTTSPSSTLSIFSTSLKPTIAVTQSMAGTPTNLFNGSNAFNYLNITDNANSTTSLGLDVYQSVGGSGTSGNHIAVKGFTYLNSPFTANENVSNYVGVWGIGGATVNVGGTSGAAVGNAFGINPQVILNPGATFFMSAVGEEIDTSVASGASTNYKMGLDITTIGNDAVQGSLLDAAEIISAVSSSPAWNNGIVFSRFSGGAPISTTGTLIGADSFTAAHGIDISKVTCTSDCFKSNGFTVNGSGYLGIGTTTPASPIEVISANQSLINTPAAMQESLLTNSAQGANVGGAIGLGGLTSSLGTQRVFGVVAGRKANSVDGDTSGYLSLSTSSHRNGID